MHFCARQYKRRACDIYSIPKRVEKADHFPALFLSRGLEGCLESAGNGPFLESAIGQYRRHETQFQSLGQEDPLEESTAIHLSQCSCWRVPRTEAAGGLQSTGLKARTRLKRLSTHAVSQQPTVRQRALHSILSMDLCGERIQERANICT